LPLLKFQPSYTRPYSTKPTHTHIDTLQNKLKQKQYKIHNKRNSHHIF